MSTQVASPRVAVTGAIVFVVSDAITFVALLGAAITLRLAAHEWPQGEGASIAQLAALSALLFAGSGAIALASTARPRWLLVAAAFALAFVAGELIEWRALLRAQHGPASDLRHASLFVVTGLHALHVTVGALLLARLGLRGATSVALRVLSLYWVALDLVWLGIVGALYLG